jgi:hypothetical protein
MALIARVWRQWRRGFRCPVESGLKCREGGVRFAEDDG